MSYDPYGGPPIPQPVKKKSKWKLWVGGGIVAFLALVLVSAVVDGTTDKDPQAAPSPTPLQVVPADTSRPPVPPSVNAPPAATYSPTPTKAAPPPPKTYGDGTYQVGKDIKPGRYKAKGGELCYWERSRDTDDPLRKIIENNLGQGQQVVTLRAGDYAFETQGCGDWIAA